MGTQNKWLTATERRRKGRDKQWKTAKAPEGAGERTAKGLRQGGEKTAKGRRNDRGRQQKDGGRAATGRGGGCVHLAMTSRPTSPGGSFLTSWR